jgi:hypothetical protein
MTTNLMPNGSGAVTRTMDEWQDYFNINIVHPGGWIEDNIPGGNFPLTEATFLDLAKRSSLSPEGDLMGFFKYVRELEENGGIFMP